MTRKWLKNWLGTSIRKATTGRPRFAPQVVRLEDRDVPATFYVDADTLAGSTVFNAGRAGAVTGLTFGVNLFNDFDTAITTANAAPGSDEIRISNGNVATGGVTLINSAVDAEVSITGSVTIIGFGPGESILAPANDHQFAVLVATGGATVNFRGVSFFGGAAGYDGVGNVSPGSGVVGAFIRYQAGAKGTVEDSAFNGIFANGNGGVGLDLTGAGVDVTIRNTTFSSIGRLGINADTGAKVTVLGSTYTGKGRLPFIEGFVQILNGSSGVISGNTVSGINGNNVDSSVAVLVSAGGGAASSAQIFGNRFFGNQGAIVVGGDVAADLSTANIQYNNFVGNVTGIGTRLAPAAPDVVAPNNWWNARSGPFNTTTNPGGQGDVVADDVAFANATHAPVPVVAATTLLGYQQLAFVHDPLVGVGGIAGQSAFKVANPTVTPEADPFAGFGNGNRVALGDVNCDDVLDLIVVSGPGVAGAARIFDGRTGTQLFAFNTLSGFTGGTLAAAGDLNGDGFAEVIIVPDVGGGPRAQVWNFATGTATVVADIFAFGDQTFRGGMRVAAGDVNGDGFDDVAFTYGPGGGPNVIVLRGQNLFNGQANQIAQFFAFQSTLRTGTNIAIGDVNGDGFGDLIAAPDVGGSPVIRIFSGATITAAAGPTLISQFCVQDVNLRTGARVASRDLNYNGRDDVIAGLGTGGSSRVNMYFTAANPPAGIPTPDAIFDLYGNPTSGVFVG